MNGYIEGPYEAAMNSVHWQINDKNGVQVGDACADCVDGYSDDGTIKKDMPKGEAVARLFAAAPELLEALKTIVKLQDEKIKNPEMVWPYWNTPLFYAARAAIAKAEGRE